MRRIRVAARRDSVPADRQLDLRVAVTIMGYRWVEWNHALLQGALVDEPGRFLARPDAPLAHLQVPASPSARDRLDALASLPEFASDLQLAAEAAETTGLFRHGGAGLSQKPNGEWILEVAASGRWYSGDNPASLVCLAALDWVRRRDREPSGR